MTLKVKVKTAFALGIGNILRFFFYKLGVASGLNPVKKISASLTEGIFFRKPARNNHVELDANEAWTGGNLYFGWFSESNTSATPPSWHLNPFNGKTLSISNRPWWTLLDFDPEVGDIKGIWEASRFDWVLSFAQQASKGNALFIDPLNDWLTDWIKNNPPYLGPNWKCGQEASIRVMHLAMAALILDQVREPELGLASLVKTHLKRIEPTISYAIAQDNNHGTSEAAALFIGGSWLYSLNDSKGEKWQNLGRKWLENRAARLIEEDGSFSQYSVNYHRVVLDTYSMVEVWRKTLGLPLFSKGFYSHLSKASQWLYQFTQPETGDAPNLGANDGARLLPLTATDYRDFRPSVQLSMALFDKSRAYIDDGPWNQPLKWLGIVLPDETAGPLQSQQFDNGGYSLLRQGSAFAMLSYPRYRFRPSQADALHLDFWIAGENRLRDAGTYSYNSGDESIRYFGGTESHNTVQFDDRDQMPRLGRFLFADWLKAEKVIPAENVAGLMECAAGYTDGWGASHYRHVALGKGLLRIEDRISGFRKKAVLRWRLQPGNWNLSGNCVCNGREQLIVTTDLPIRRIELVEGWESRYYMCKKNLPVLEVEVDTAGKILTEYNFKE